MLADSTRVMMDLVWSEMLRQECARLGVEHDASARDATVLAMLGPVEGGG